MRQRMTVGDVTQIFGGLTVLLQGDIIPTPIHTRSEEPFAIGDRVWLVEVEPAQWVVMGIVKSSIDFFPAPIQAPDPTVILDIVDDGVRLPDGTVISPVPDAEPPPVDQTRGEIQIVGVARANATLSIQQVTGKEFRLFSGGIPQSITYAWFRNGTQIEGASGTSIVVDAGWVGDSIHATASFQNDDSAMNTYTTPNSNTIVISQSTDPNPPTGLPVITGTLTPGTTATADVSGVGDLDGIDPTTTRFVWMLSGNVVGGNSSTLPITEQYSGQELSITYSFSDVLGNPSGPLTSAPRIVPSLVAPGTLAVSVSLVTRTSARVIVTNAIPNSLVTITRSDGFTVTARASSAGVRTFNNTGLTPGTRYTVTASAIGVNNGSASWTTLLPTSIRSVTIQRNRYDARVAVIVNNPAAGGELVNLRVLRATGNRDRFSVRTNFRGEAVFIIEGLLIRRSYVVLVTLGSSSRRAVIPQFNVARFDPDNAMLIIPASGISRTAVREMFVTIIDYDTSRGDSIRWSYRRVGSPRWTRYPEADGRGSSFSDPADIEGLNPLTNYQVRAQLFSNNEAAGELVASFRTTKATRADLSLATSWSLLIPQSISQARTLSDELDDLKRRADLAELLMRSIRDSLVFKNVNGAIRTYNDALREFNEANSAATTLVSTLNSLNSLTTRIFQPSSSAGSSPISYSRVGQSITVKVSRSTVSFNHGVRDLIVVAGTGSFRNVTFSIENNLRSVRSILNKLISTLSDNTDVPENFDAILDSLIPDRRRLGVLIDLLIRTVDSGFLNRDSLNRDLASVSSFLRLLTQEVNL